MTDALRKTIAPKFTFREIPIAEVAEGTPTVHNLARASNDGK